MKHFFFQIIALALLAGPFRAVAQTDNPIGSHWAFGYTFSGGFTFPGQALFLDPTSDQVLDEKYGYAYAGTYTVSGRTVTLTLTQYSDYFADYTGTLDATTNKMSGTVTLTPVIAGGTLTAHSGTFQASRPPATTGKLTFKEIDKLYQVGTTAFSLFQFSATGSISLDMFPNTDPTALDLPSDTELTIEISHDSTTDLVIHGGTLSDAVLDSHTTSSRKAFHYLPFAPETFFDGLAELKIPIPKSHKTGAFTLAAGWIFTGPHNKPATAVKFSVIGVGRAWVSTAGGGAGNAQGISALSTQQLGNPDARIPSIEYDCKITFGNATKQVSVGPFPIAGPGVVATNEKAKPSDKRAVKMSTVTLSLKGPVKPSS